MRHVGIRRKSQHPSRAESAGGFDRAEDTNMKTDEVVTALSMSVEPVDRRLVNRSVAIALGVGAAIALGLVLVALGVRADLSTPRAVTFLFLKLAFALGTVGAASVYLIRLAR